MAVCHQTQSPQAQTSKTKTLQALYRSKHTKSLHCQVIHPLSLKTPSSGTSLVSGCSTSEGTVLSFKMAGMGWKISALVAVLALFAVLEFQTVEAQALVNECRTGAARCDVNAYCYDTVSAYRCICRRGWYGDGVVGAGYTGCQRRKLSAWQVATSIVGSILGALLILCCCLACIRNAMRARAARNNAGQQGNPTYGYPAQQAYPPQQGVPMYATNTQKVPGPAGVV